MLVVSFREIPGLIEDQDWFCFVLFCFKWKTIRKAQMKWITVSPKLTILFLILK